MNDKNIKNMSVKYTATPLFTEKEQEEKVISKLESISEKRIKQRECINNELISIIKNQKLREQVSIKIEELLFEHRISNY